MHTMRVVLGGYSSSSAAAAAVARSSSSFFPSSLSPWLSQTSSLRAFHGTGNRINFCTSNPVSILGNCRATMPPSSNLRASSGLPRVHSSSSTSFWAGSLGSIMVSTGTTTASRASSTLRRVAPRQLATRTVSDAARGAKHKSKAMLSNDRNVNFTHPLGGSFFFVQPHSLSSFHGLGRPTGAVLAQYYSSSPFGGGSGRGGGGGGGNRWAAGGLGLVGAASVLLGKSKYLLGALKLTKLASLGSMVFTVGTYSMFFGLPYAAGMVGLILVHETGHALMMRQRGVDFSPMVFVPFVGAFIAMRNQPRDAYEDALIAFGGPVLGGAGAGVVAVAASATQSQLLFALADFGFMINLFNLLPIGAMDGGRIASALSPYAGVAGLGLGGMLAYSGVVQNPIFYLILLAGGWETFQRFYNPASVPPNYYRITPLQRATLTTSYFGLVAALMAGMAWNHRYQKPPELLMRERQREMSWDMR